MSAFSIEKPTFELIAQSGEVEVRRYPELIVARTRVEATFNNAGSEGFRRLGGYIFGSNQDDQKISMTAPVSQMPAEDGGYWVNFFMPSEYDLSTLPDPKDASVELTMLPAVTFAVLRYRGGWSEDKYRQHESRLRQWLSQQDIWVESGPAVWSRYNPPFIPPFLKTNEVMIPIQRR